MRHRLGVAALGAMAIFSCWTGISHAQAMHDPGRKPAPALHTVPAGQLAQMRIRELAREVHSSRDPGKLHQLIQELQSLGKKENDPKLRQQMTHLEEQARLQLMQFNRPADPGSHQQAKGRVGLKTLATMQSTLEAMELGPLLAIFLQSFIVQFLMYVLSAVIFVIINGRMVEIYLMVSLAPLPFATFGNREQSMMGQNYMRSLFALGFQGFLIMVCVGIYAVLIQSVAFSTDIIASLWKVMGFTILLAFTLFKTGAVAHSIFHAH